MGTIQLQPKRNYNFNNGAPDIVSYEFHLGPDFRKTNL